MSHRVQATIPTSSLNGSLTPHSAEKRSCCFCVHKDLRSDMAERIEDSDSASSRSASPFDNNEDRNDNLSHRQESSEPDDKRDGLGISQHGRNYTASIYNKGLGVDDNIEGGASHPSCALAHPLASMPIESLDEHHSEPSSSQSSVSNNAVQSNFDSDADVPTLSHRHLPSWKSKLKLRVVEPMLATLTCPREQTQKSQLPFCRPAG